MSNIYINPHYDINSRNGMGYDYSFKKSQSFNKNIKVYICSKSSNEFKSKIKKYGVKCIEVSSQLEINPDIFITTQFMGVYKNNQIVEQGIVLKDKDSIIFLTGCAHSGIVLMSRDVIKNFGLPIKILAGGFHLKNLSNMSYKLIIDSLINLKIQKIAPCHCNSQEVINISEENFKKNFINLKVGTTFSF